MELLCTLQLSIIQNDVDSFHHHLTELEQVVQNNERMRRLLEQLLWFAVKRESNLVVETLIQKGVGKE